MTAYYAENEYDTNEITQQSVKSISFSNETPIKKKISTFKYRIYATCVAKNRNLQINKENILFVRPHSRTLVLNANIYNYSIIKIDFNN